MGVNIFNDGSLRLHVGPLTSEIDMIYTIERETEKMIFYIMFKEKELIVDVFAEVFHGVHTEIETYSDNWAGHPNIEEFYKNHYGYKDYIDELKSMYNNLNLDLIRVNHLLLDILGVQKEYTMEELSAVMRG